MALYQLFAEAKERAHKILEEAQSITITARAEMEARCQGLEAEAIVSAEKVIREASDLANVQVLELRRRADQEVRQLLGAANKHAPAAE